MTCPPGCTCGRHRPKTEKFSALLMRANASRANNAQAFWRRVDKRGPNACWPWAGSCFGNGYGQFNYQGKNRRAHRVAFYLTHGHWPAVCRHTCDNPPCCNPAHLRDGTHKDNAKDRSDRGRFVSNLPGRAA